MKRKLLFIITLFLSVSIYAQQRTELRGNVINSATNEPVSGVVVTLQNQSETTDGRGEFHFTSVSSGETAITLRSSKILPRELYVEIGTDATSLLKDIQVIVVENAQNAALVGVVDEIMLDDDAENSSQEISSTVILSNDKYLSTVGYQLSPLRFKVRGYSNTHEKTYINGVNFNDQHRGVFNFASIGALNDVTRNGDVVNYHGLSSFTYGSIRGAKNVNMRASNYTKGTKLTLSYTNRIYYMRGMATYSTGLRDDGWAFTASVGGRFSDEGSIDGTFYRNLSYALSLEKQWNNNEHSLSFVTFGSPVQRGQQGASYQEAYNLTGNNHYNPNWGWQNGKKRNAKVVKAYDPTTIVSHIWNINDKTNLTTGFGTHYARYGNTALNWYNGPDPRPDYYRHLPYYASNEDMYNYYSDLWKLKDSPIRQIDWKGMYRANELARREGNGAAIYMVEERRNDLFEMSLNSTLNTIVTEKHKITTGIGLRRSISKQFKTVDDLLGAEYVLDIDKFAERDFAGNRNIVQNDLNRPDRKVYEGDTFGYNFRMYINSANTWIQNQYNISRHLDLHYGAKVTYTNFQRDGKMQNGRYPDNSYGKGERHSFVDFGAKAGLTYKITGRHILTGNVSYSTEAPLPNEAYISPRISDHAIRNLESGKIFSADLNYIFSMPSFNGRVSVFQTNFYDQMHRISYYYDSERTFVNHVLRGMTKIHRGVELGVGYKLNNSWSFDLAGTVAEYYYGNNPDGVISYENGKEADFSEKAYLKNYYIGGTPQIAGTFNINYFYDYWFIKLYVNGFGRNYIELAPLRRLASNYATINPNDPEQMDAYNYLVNQERFGSAYTLDFSVGKMIYLKNRQTLNFNFSFNNLTNRKNIRTGGYEQSRIDVTAPQKFGSKYYYMQGFNCFLNMSYRF